MEYTRSDHTLLTIWLKVDCIFYTSNNHDSRIPRTDPCQIFDWEQMGQKLWDEYKTQAHYNLNAAIKMLDLIAYCQDTPEIKILKDSMHMQYWISTKVTDIQTAILKAAKHVIPHKTIHPRSTNNNQNARPFLPKIKTTRIYWLISKLITYIRKHQLNNHVKINNRILNINCLNNLSIPLLDNGSDPDVWIIHTKLEQDKVYDHCLVDECKSMLKQIKKSIEK